RGAAPAERRRGTQPGQSAAHPGGALPHALRAGGGAIMTGQAAARPAGLELASAELTGTGILTRLALRRDRIMMAAWVYVLAAFAYVSVVSTKKLYPTAASLRAFAEGAGADRVTRAIYGPAG